MVEPRTKAATEARKDKLAKFEGDILILSTKAMCAVLGVSAETLSKYVKQGCPKYATGWWDARQVVDWRLGNGKKGNAEQRKLEAEVKYREIKAEMEEIKKMELTGRYVAVDDIEKRLAELFTRVKQGLIFNGAPGCYRA